MDNEIIRSQYMRILLACGLALAAGTKTDAVEASAAATLFAEPDFKGVSVVLPAGDYNTEKLKKC